MAENQFYLVKAELLPEIFLKVMKVKELLSAGKCTSVNEAVRKVELSRSAYYKYKDAILPFYENSQGKILSLLFLTEDFPGVLSGIMDCLARAQVNILTITQNYPIDGLADISLVVDTARFLGDLDELMQQLDLIPGVRERRVLARRSLNEDTR